MQSHSFIKYLFKNSAFSFFLLFSVMLILFNFLFFIFFYSLFIQIPFFIFTVVFIIIRSIPLKYLVITENAIIEKNIILFWNKNIFKKEDIIIIKNSRLPPRIDHYRIKNFDTLVYDRAIAIEAKGQYINGVLVNNYLNHLADHNNVYFIELYNLLEKYHYPNAIFNNPLALKISSISDDLDIGRYVKVNNEEFIQDVDSTFFDFSFSLVISLASSMLYFNSLNGKFFLLLLIPFFHFLYLYKFTSKLIVYNRRLGTITYPCSKFSKKTKTVPFSELKLYNYLIPTNQNNLFDLFFVSPNKKDVLTLYTGKYSDDFLSFIVWFMDKNRPLPPGSAFDKYRQLEYNRRKSEGNPKPLFESDIVINENHI